MLLLVRRLWEEHLVFSLEAVALEVEKWTDLGLLTLKLNSNMFSQRWKIANWYHVQR
jgi:hypothetical protein